MGRDGKALRIGAEGLLAKRSGMPVSIIGGQALITGEDIATLLSAKRSDLPQASLVWEEGLRNLVIQLSGQAL